MHRIAGRAGRIRSLSNGRLESSWHPQSFQNHSLVPFARKLQTTTARPAAKPTSKSSFTGTPAGVVNFPRNDSTSQLHSATTASTPQPVEREDTISSIRRAMFLPIPATYPSLNNPTLESHVFGTNTDKTSPYAIAYHSERLEWLGDRELNNIAAEVCFVLGPSDSVSLSFMQNQFIAISTNAFGGKVAKHCGIAAKFKSKSGGGPAADDVIPDRFEAYIAALYLVGGREATRTFLAPYFYHQIMSTYDSLPPLSPSSTKSPSSFVPPKSTAKSSPHPAPVATPPTQFVPSPINPPATPGSVTVKNAPTPLSPNTPTKTASARLVPSGRRPAIRVLTPTPAKSITTPVPVATPIVPTVAPTSTDPPSFTPSTTTSVASSSSVRIVTDDPDYDSFMYYGEPVITTSVAIAAQQLSTALSSRAENDHPLTRRIRRVGAILTCRLDYGYPTLEYKLTTQSACYQVDVLRRLIRRLLLFKLVEINFSTPSRRNVWRDYVAASIPIPIEPVATNQSNSPSTASTAILASTTTPELTINDAAALAAPTSRQPETESCEDASNVASMDSIDELDSMDVDDVDPIPTDVSILHALTSSQESEVGDTAPLPSSSSTAMGTLDEAAVEEENLTVEEVRNDEAILRAFTMDREVESDYSGSTSGLESQESTDDSVMLDSEPEERDDENPEALEFVLVDSRDGDELELDSMAEELNEEDNGDEKAHSSNGGVEEGNCGASSSEMVEEEIEEVVESSDATPGPSKIIEMELSGEASREADDLAEIHQSIEREAESTTKEMMETFSAEELDAMASFSNGSRSRSSSLDPPDSDSPPSTSTDPDQIDVKPAEGVSTGAKSLLTQAAGVLSAFRSPWKRS